MKLDPKRYAAALREGAATAVRRHPVEMALLLCFSVLWCLAFEFDWSFERLGVRLIVGFWYALAMFVVERWTGRGPWRRIYYVAWVPLVPLLLWPGLAEWVESTRFAVTVFVLTPLALLVVRRAADNLRFVTEGCLYLRSAVLALLFASVALGLFEAILWSTAYIFGFEDAEWVAHLAVHALILAECFAAPVLFLMMVDRWEGAECRGSRVLEVLVNYVLVPAVVIYAALLYLYAAKILVVWTLPRGGIAWMASVFVLVSLVVRMVRELLEKRTCAWFFRLFGVVTLPAAVLFWAGVARRIGEYGLTESRVWLLACGIVMTLAVGLFLTRRTARYLWLCVGALLIFGAVTYVPALSPARLGFVSQQARFERIARALELTDAEGRLRTSRAPLADTVRWKEYREAFAALTYLMNEDTAYYRQLGVAPERRWSIEEDLLPEALQRRVNPWLADTIDVDEVDATIAEYELPGNVPVPEDAAYPHLYAHPEHWRGMSGLRFANDTVRLTLDGELLLEIPGGELVRRQAERCGVPVERLGELEDGEIVRLLDYRGERVRILFGTMKIERLDSAEYTLCGVTAELFWTR